VLLFQSRFHDGLVSGEISLTFRLWPKARVKPAGRYRCHPIGVLEVDAVDRIAVGDISGDEARRAGFSDRASLVRYLQGFSSGKLTDDSLVYRVALHYAGDGDRVPGALDADPSEDEIAGLVKRLHKLDTSGKEGAWTEKTLLLIEQNPRIAASKLARMVGRETAPFKADVVKLKKLALTQSFEVGYELSPKGRALLRHIRPGPA
jgi:hypothetical protein